MLLIRNFLKNIENKLQEFNSLNKEIEKLTIHFKKEEDKYQKLEKNLRDNIDKDLREIRSQVQVNEFRLADLDRIYSEKKNTLEEELKNYTKELEVQLQNKNSEFDIKNDEKINNLKSLYDNTFTSVSWLTEKYSEFHFLIDEKFILKYNPNLKCSQAQKEFAKENKKLRKRNLDLELQIKQIQNYVPDFEEIIESNIEDFEDDYLDDETIITEEKINKLISEKEQETLTKPQILQIALDKYVNKRKSKKAIGDDYEKYIGHLYEQKGYDVEYHGLKYGYDDLGIDLICKKNDEILLIQCKNWSEKKNIYENAINQLFGTSIKYYIDKFDDYQNSFRDTLFEENNIPFNSKFRPIFITTTKLTERAEEFAKILKIDVLKIPYIKNFPRIKCNIGKDENGLKTKIYHLPFDQQYNKVQNIKNGGFNALTVEEAENKGFRKAFRWHGE